MFTHLLVAVDFSSEWPALAARARALRGLGAARITLIHVLSTRYPSVPAETHRAHYQEILNGYAGNLAAAGLSVETEILTGEPGQVLADVGTALDVDLLLAGMRGHDRGYEFFLGSTALDLARLVDRPLWLEPMPSDRSGSEVRRVLLATDGSPAAAGAEAMFARLATSAERAIAVHVVSGSDPDDEGIERRDSEKSFRALSERVKGLEARVLSGFPPSVVVHVAEEEDVDLIVIGKRGRSAIRALLLGSVAEGICRRSRRPVLLTPASV